MQKLTQLNNKKITKEKSTVRPIPYIHKHAPEYFHFTNEFHCLCMRSQLRLEDQIRIRQQSSIFLQPSLHTHSS